jgi:four helix bundle protein
MLERTNFENLRVYQMLETLADAIWETVMTWPNFARDTVGKQLVRSADGIGANIAEGSGRGTTKDKRHFLRMARGSVNETKHWLRRAFRRSLLSAAQAESLKETMDVLAPSLNAYYRSIGESNRPDPDT